jgi:hypothetical protein
LRRQGKAAPPQRAAARRRAASPSPPHLDLASADIGRAPPPRASPASRPVRLPVPPALRPSAARNAPPVASVAALSCCPSRLAAARAMRSVAAARSHPQSDDPPGLGGSPGWGARVKRSGAAFSAGLERLQGPEGSVQASAVWYGGWRRRARLMRARRLRHRRCRPRRLSARSAPQEGLCSQWGHERAAAAAGRWAARGGRRDGAGRAAGRGAHGAARGPGAAPRWRSAPGAPALQPRRLRFAMACGRCGVGSGVRPGPWHRWTPLLALSRGGVRANRAAWARQQPRAQACRQEGRRLSARARSPLRRWGARGAARAAHGSRGKGWASLRGAGRGAVAGERARPGVAGRSLGVGPRPRGAVRSRAQGKKWLWVRTCAPCQLARAAPAGAVGRRAWGRRAAPRRAARGRAEGSGRGPIVGVIRGRPALGARREGALRPPALSGGRAGARARGTCGAGRRGQQGWLGGKTERESSGGLGPNGAGAGQQGAARVWQHR